MSQYYMLLKNGLADFDKILIDKYSLIGLDEVDAILLIKLKKILETKKNVNEKKIITELSKTMSISNKVISEKIVSLINNQYIALAIVDNKETYTLDDTYKRLANIIDDESDDEEKEEKNSDIKRAVSFIEKECEKMITPLELEVIKHWVDVDKFTFAQIKEATLECLKLKRKSIKYIDILLNKDKVKENKSKQAPKGDMLDLFNTVYGRIKK